MTSSQEEVLNVKPLRELDCEMVEQSDRNGNLFYVIKNKKNDTYIRLSQVLFEFFHLMDGKRAIGYILREVFTSGETVGFDYIFKLLSLLYKKKLMLAQTDQDKVVLESHFNAPSKKTTGSLSLLRKIGGKFIKTKLGFKGADRCITQLYNIVGKYLFTRISVSTISAISLLGIVLFGVQLNRISFSMKELLTVEGSYFIGIAIFYIGALLLTVLHELGHALTCKHFGRKVDSMGIMLYYGAIVFFTDVTDTWILSKKKRITVAAAGIVVNVIVGSLLSIAAFLFGGSTLICTLCLKGAFLSFLGVFGNLVPFLKYDGYYIISDLLESPNLREESFASVFSLRSWKEILKGRQPGRAKTGVFIFGLISLVYSALVLVIGMVSLSSVTYEKLPPPYNAYASYFLVLLIGLSLISFVRGKVKSNHNQYNSYVVKS